MKQSNLIRIIIDLEIEPGLYRVGGARVVCPTSDRELGRELRTTEVRVHDHLAAAQLRRIIRQTDGLEETA